MTHANGTDCTGKHYQNLTSLHLMTTCLNVLTLILFLDRILTIIGAMPSLSFVKHLINTIVFHNTTSQLGKPDLFIVLPKHHYEVIIPYHYLIKTFS